MKLKLNLTWIEETKSKTWIKRQVIERTKKNWTKAWNQRESFKRWDKSEKFLLKGNKGNKRIKTKIKWKREIRSKRKRKRNYGKQSHVIQLALY